MKVRLGWQARGLQIRHHQLFDATDSHLVSKLASRVGRWFGV
jgi:hypothetical protein